MTHSQDTTPANPAQVTDAMVEAAPLSCRLNGPVNIEDAAAIDRTQKEAADLSKQINRLADFIMAEVPGEPSQSEGAVDTAIRWMRAAIAQAPAGGEWREPDRWRSKLNLWFFRDLSDEQRLKLFSLFELPVDEIGKVHSHQRKALDRCLPASPKEG